ncbi:hypothetical protein Pan14r_13190 [Crateriforma conspicua]|uniref:Uncharacterized protein n=1 Tax=Crateriforma conspicua TaxID=2527996 RepID=A0A5C5Y423_9PLAN|nr:hypothetical protein Pan14r_13190 [Crateriforma conspicua]
MKTDFPGEASLGRVRRRILLILHLFFDELEPFTEQKAVPQAGTTQIRIVAVDQILFATGRPQN